MVFIIQTGVKLWVAETEIKSSGRDGVVCVIIYDMTAYGAVPVIRRCFCYELNDKMELAGCAKSSIGAMNDKMKLKAVQKVVHQGYERQNRAKSHRKCRSSEL